MQPGPGNFVYNLGHKYWNLLLVNYCQGRDDVQKLNSIDGNGQFRMCLMKGQYAFYFETTKPGSYKSTIRIVQRSNL